MNERDLRYDLPRVQSGNMQKESVFEDGLVNYISLPSLQSIAVVNVVITLWKHPDLRYLMQEYTSKLKSNDKCHSDNKMMYIKRMEEKVGEKLTMLCLPTSLKTQIFHVIRPIGLQLLDWIDSTKKYYFDLHNSIDFVDSILWTSKGVIDKTKTLELQFCEKIVDQHIFTVYSFACRYCSENFIIHLWQKMSPETKENIKSLITLTDDNLILYWTCFAENELNKFLQMVDPNDSDNVYNWNHSLYQNIFTYSLSVGNALAVKYFWSFLTFEEICNNIEEWADFVAEQVEDWSEFEYHYYQGTNQITDILCFLLSQMNDKEQQKVVFQKHTDVILECLLLNWPFQKLFLPTISLMWDFLNGEQFATLLSKVRVVIKACRSGKHLRELWYRSPLHLKKFFFSCYEPPGRCRVIHMDSFNVLQIFRELLEIRDLESFNCIMNDATIEEKRNIFANIQSSAELKELIRTGNLIFLDEFLTENLSEEKINDFKRRTAFFFGPELCTGWISDNNYQAANNFIDWGLSLQDDVNHFKESISHFVLHECIEKNNYELADKVLKYCFKSEEDIEQFKIDYVMWKKFIKVRRIKLKLFKQFFDWCRFSDSVANQIKRDMKPYMHEIILNLIVAKHRFTSSNLLVSWCFGSAENIKEFKRNFLLSEEVIILFVRCINNSIFNYSKCSSWKSIEKLLKWFYPLNEETVYEFKQKINAECPFNSELNYTGYQPKSKENAFMYLIDTFAKGNSSDNDNSVLLNSIEDESDSDDCIGTDTELDRTAQALLSEDYEVTIKY